jgi:hypothetical protein
MLCIYIRVRSNNVLFNRGKLKAKRNNKNIGFFTLNYIFMMCLNESDLSIKVDVSFWKK